MLIYNVDLALVSCCELFMDECGIFSFFT